MGRKLKKGAAASESNTGNGRAQPRMATELDDGPIIRSINARPRMAAERTFRYHTIRRSMRGKGPRKRPPLPPSHPPAGIVRGCRTAGKEPLPKQRSGSRPRGAYGREGTSRFPPGIPTRHTSQPQRDATVHDRRKHMRTLLANATVITMNPARDVLDTDILIENGVIADMGPGLADEMELMDWLQRRIWPLEGAHTPETNAAAARLAAAEGLRSGVTAFIDMGTAHCQDAIFEAMRDVGMRGLFGKCMLDMGGTDVPAALMEDTETCLRESERLMNRWHMSAGGRLRYAFAPRFVPSCTETLLTRTRDMARANGVRLHTHASENKGECAYVESLVHMRNLRYLHSIGYTGEDVILAHCIWIDDDEIRILADTGTHAVHCPSSNMKLASGIARIDEMLAAGCRVAIGLDGAHNHMDALVELRQAGILQKVRTNRPTALSPLQVLEMATLGGARAMGQEDELGSLEPGKKADLAVINPDRLNMAPRIGRDPVAQVVYQATHENVEATMVDGVFLYRDGKYASLDLKECLRDAENACARILRSPDVAPLFAH